MTEQANPNGKQTRGHSGSNGRNRRPGFNSEVIGNSKSEGPENSNIEIRNPNGADGIRDIEGKAARVAARERGSRTSFKQARITERENDPNGKVRLGIFLLFKPLVIVSSFVFRISNFSYFTARSNRDT